MARQEGKVLGVWMPCRIRALVERAAVAGTRSVSQQIRRYVLEGLRRDGLLDEAEG